jgi:hypothetical protein
MCSIYYIRIRIRYSMSRICHKKKRSTKWHVASYKQMVKESMSIRYKYSYYDLKFYVTFVFTNSFDIPWQFGCLNVDTTNRKQYTLQGLIEADCL